MWNALTAEISCYPGSNDNAWEDPRRFEDGESQYRRDAHDHNSDRICDRDSRHSVCGERNKSYRHGLYESKQIGHRVSVTDITQQE